MIISDSLSPASRVWIYQSNEPFPTDKIDFIRQNVKAFCKQWISHNNQLKADGEVLHNRFVVLSVDESQAGASGCSIDKSVHFIKALERELNVNMFDRMRFSFQNEKGIQTVSSEEFGGLYQSGTITDETLVFDNLVKTKADLEESWLKPLKNSWHARFV